METVIVFHAMGRSGHHAVMDWITHQWKGRSESWNNTFKGWDRGELCSAYYSIPITHGPEDSDNILSIYSLEDSIPCRWEKYGMAKFDCIKRADRAINITLFRDHYNWAASSFGNKSPAPDIYHINETGYRGTRMDILLAQQDEFACRTHYMNDLEHYYINFNKWFSDIEYRKQIAAYLDLEFTDATINNVCIRGGNGSTFEGMNDDGKAQQSKVLERWKNLINIGRYQNCVSDPRLVKFTREYHGMEPPFKFNLEIHEDQIKLAQAEKQRREQGKL